MSSMPRRRLLRKILPVSTTSFACCSCLCICAESRFPRSVRHKDRGPTDAPCARVGGKAVFVQGRGGAHTIHVRRACHKPIHHAYVHETYRKPVSYEYYTCCVLIGGDEHLQRTYCVLHKLRSRPLLVHLMYYKKIRHTIGTVRRVFPDRSRLRFRDRIMYRCFAGFRRYLKAEDAGHVVRRRRSAATLDAIAHSHTNRGNSHGSQLPLTAGSNNRRSYTSSSSSAACVLHGLARKLLLLRLTPRLSMLLRVGGRSAHDSAVISKHDGAARVGVGA